MKKMFVVVTVMVSILFSFSVLAESKTAYQFGVFPYLPPTKLQTLFTPISRDFEQKLEKDVRISSKPSYAEFTEGLTEEMYDIAFVQPFDYVKAHDKHNYLPLARRGGALSAIIIVRKDSPLTAIEDLKGKVIANPPRVAAVSQLTSMTLLEADINPTKDVTREYGKSHFSCMQSVLIGTADACGTAKQALAHFEEKQMEERFRILHTTTSVPHSLFVVHKRVSESVRELLLNTILNWPNNEPGRSILDNGHFIPFVQAKDDEYDAVRKFWQRESQ